MSLCDQFSQFAADFRTHRTASPVDGEYYGIPGITVYHTYTQPLPAKGRVELNLVAPEAAASFEWAAEITINDKASGRFIHLITRPDNSCAETYGKTVLPITEERGTEILAILRELTDA